MAPPSAQITFASHNELKLGWHQRIQADVQQIQAHMLQRRQQPRQVQPVGRDADALQTLQLPEFS